MSRHTTCAVAVILVAMTASPALAHRPSGPAGELQEPGLQRPSSVIPRIAAETHDGSRRRGIESESQGYRFLICLFPFLRYLACAGFSYHLNAWLSRHPAYRLAFGGVIAIGIIGWGFALILEPRFWDDPKVRTSWDVRAGLGVIVFGCVVALGLYVEFWEARRLPAPTGQRLFQGSPAGSLEDFSVSRPPVPTAAQLLLRLTACLETAPINREELRTWLDTARCAAGLDWRVLYDEAVRLHRAAHPEDAHLIPAPEEVEP